MFSKKKKKGLGGLAGAMVGVLVSVIITVAVVIPVVASVIDTANLTGTTATIIGYIPMLLAVVIFAAIAALIG